MDLCGQERRVYYTDTYRGRRCRKICFRRDEHNPLRGFQLYRCYVVWQSKLVMILPLLLWCAAGGTCVVCSGVVWGH